MAMVRIADVSHPECERIRGEAIRSQLQLGFTLCAAAAQSIAFRHLDHAERVVRHLRKSTQTIEHHLGLTHHIPSSLVPELRVELRRLEEQIAHVERQLPEFRR